MGQSAGARDWHGARHRARLAVTCSLGAGGLAAVALAALQRPISAFLHLEAEVRAPVRFMWLCLRPTCRVFAGLACRTVVYVLVPTAACAFNVAAFSRAAQGVVQQCDSQ